MTDDASVLLLPVKVGLLVGHRSPSLSACCDDTRAQENVDLWGPHGRLKATRPTRLSASTKTYLQSCRTSRRTRGRAETWGQTSRKVSIMGGASGAAGGALKLLTIALERCLDVLGWSCNTKHHVSFCPRAEVTEVRRTSSASPDCLRARRYGRLPSSSSGRLFLDFSGVYVSSSGGSAQAGRTFSRG